MMQYIALLWTEKKGKLLQVFGPYPTEKSAQDAADRVADWPAIKDGQWEVVPLYPNPKQPVQQTAAPQSWTGAMNVALNGVTGQIGYPFTITSDQYLPYSGQVTIAMNRAYVTTSGLTGEVVIQGQLTR